MKYKSILVREIVDGVSIRLNRPKQKNSINYELLYEINNVLDVIERKSEYRIVQFDSAEHVFCMGMDFEETSSFSVAGEAQKGETGDNATVASNLYSETLKRFSLFPKVIISVVDGTVLAGGVGIVAASDLVFSTSRSTFGLSEALWGLLPAMVLPYLIRRVGFQIAYRMTLTTIPISAKEAFDVRLVDQLTEQPYDDVRKVGIRLSRLQETTILKLKSYFRKLWIIDENIEKMAVNEICSLVAQPHVAENINNYIKYERFPWDPKT